MDESKMNFWKRRLRSLIRLIFLFATAAKASVEQFQTPEQEGYFSNMQVYNGSIYIGAGNDILVLNASDLELSNTTKTCESNCTNSINKVLLINSVSQILIECGTNYKGTCRVRDLNTLETVGTSTSEDPEENKYLVVSKNTLRPASFLLNADSKILFTGVTYGSGVVSEGAAYSFFLAAYKFADSGFLKRFASLHLALPEKMKVEDYIVYFKASFEANGFIYFITNQKFKADDTDYVSKIIRVCENDKDENLFWSYTDIKLECKDKNQSLNLVQDVTVFTPGIELMESLNLTNSDLVVAATFAVGSGPEKVNLSSAICLYKLQDVDRQIMEAKERFICPGSTLEKQNTYLTNRLITTCSANINVSSILCNSDLTSYRYIIGETSVTATPVYSISSAASGYLGKIQSVTVYDEYTVLYAGTSMGKLIQITVHSSSSVDVTDKSVDEGYPVTGIYIENEGKVEYSMSSRKIVRDETKDCSMYRTCKQTVKAKKALCGWCVYESRSTFKDNISCPYHLRNGHWLSPFTQCLTISAEPRGVPVQLQRSLTIKVIGEFPDALDDDSYICVFVADNITLGEVSEVRDMEGSTLFCETPASQLHMDATLQIFVNHSAVSILLAETNFLFFDCNHYKTCGSCTEDKRAECFWCAENTLCKLRSSACSLKVNQTQLCPKFDNIADKHYLPHGISKLLSFNVSNLVNVDGPNRTEYYCSLNGTTVMALTATKSTIACNLTSWLKTNTGIEDYEMEILYGTSRLDNANTVVVYNCEVLGLDCSVCGSLNPLYDCMWCSKPDTCQYKQTGCETSPCPKPTIEGVVPETAAVNGSILVQISGRELGSRPSDVNVTLAGIECYVQGSGFKASFSLFCEAQASTSTISGRVMVTVNQQVISAKNFSYKLPRVSDIIPVSGPQAGGTRLTLRGTDLGVGRRNIKVTVWNNVSEYGMACVDSDVTPTEPLSKYSSEMYSIECTTPEDEVGSTQLSYMEITFDNATVVTKNISFSYVENPEIGTMSPLKGIASGGTTVTVSGTKFKNAHHAYLTGNFQGASQPCLKETDIEIICVLQNLTSDLKTKLEEKLNGQLLDDNDRQKRDADCKECIYDEVTVHLDGISKGFNIAYYTDPTVYEFEDENGVKTLADDQNSLIIKGKNLNLVAGKNDIIVTVGLGKCPIFELHRNNLTCLLPDRQQAAGVLDTSHLVVNVSIGNVHNTVGSVKYAQRVDPQEIKWIIGAATGGFLFAIGVLIAICLLIKYRSTSYKMRNLVHQWEAEEEKLKIVAVKEFADMQIGMSAVNSHLIEKGCPYHIYQQYAVNVLFPNEPIVNHALMQEPNIPDVRRQKVHDCMKKMEGLISNKYFLLSVITTLEQQRKFKLSDRASFCGYLCIVLLGKMEYLQEICISLINNLITESAGKKNQKVLFRRCETISEKLLSRWLSLCLYPHFKVHSGYPLYLLYKASQIHMEAGPIDAITHDTKYTLSEERLLKDYPHQDGKGTNEPKFEANCLTLNVTAENRRETVECRVLDCDTITQVKEKCFAQLYINQPASKLKRKASELILEWHSGRGGKLQLSDKDNTNQTDGHWVRLNTLAHYCVQNESQMALIDPLANQGSPSGNNLVNVDQICLSPKPDTNATDSNDTRTTTRFWHVVKPETSDSQPKMLLTDMFYQNRLLTFKQAILKYIRGVFDTVLQEDTLAPHVHFLYNLFDEFREKYKIEEETIQSWKSESYLIHIWAVLMRKTTTLFDINTPPYVETTMEVISQVFVESLSRDYQDATKNSTTHKLLFNNERNHYRAEAKRFYRAVSAKQFQPEVLRNYLEDVNKMQQRETSLNKETALHKLFKQLEPYMLEILDDLSTSSETSRLRLDKKLEEINALMNNDSE